MSWPDMMTPWAARRAPGLTLGDCLRRGETGHCADCTDGGKPCPDHAETEAAS